MVALGVTAVVLRGLERESKGLVGGAVVKSVFLVILRQILGCLGPEKHGFRWRGVTKLHFSQDLIFLWFGGLFGRQFGR